MPKLREKFITNEKGRRVGVILDMRAYQRMLAELEEYECIKAYDEAMASGDEAIPFEQAIEEIERSRK